jgi:hypothetical protein
MSVYVDSVMHPLGRMKMSHMVADSTEELFAMADRIGVDRLWIQCAGTHREHFDVCAAKREKALRAGACAVTTRFIGEFLRKRSAKLEVRHR